MYNGNVINVIFHSLSRITNFNKLFIILNKSEVYTKFIERVRSYLIYHFITPLTGYTSNCNFGLMKTQISWIVCDRDSSKSGIFGNLELVKTGLMTNRVYIGINSTCGPIAHITLLQASMLCYYGNASNVS